METLAYILKKEDRFWLYHSPKYQRALNEDDLDAESDNLNQYLWRSIRDSCPSEEPVGKKLFKGDILKFGRNKFRVRDIILSS